MNIFAVTVIFLRASESTMGMNKYVHFQMDFLDLKCMDFAAVSSKGSNWQYHFVQIMAWRRQGDKSLFEPMTHIWLNEFNKFV